MSLALSTDLYELTMAQGYWALGMADQPAVFHHFYRTQPFGGPICVAAGLGTLIDELQKFRFREEDCNYLASLEIFDPKFLDLLQQIEWRWDVDAVEEGTLVQPNTPIVRITGPLLQVQILETLLLTIMNFQMLVATKAARCRQAAPEDEIIEFGLRRSQGPNGGLMGARAAYVGGCDSTSNVLAGKTYGIPVRGTHAHSWIMAFPDELSSFEGYAKVFPDDSLFLVDTYETLEGVKNAIKVGKIAGVRLDSGDLLALSKETRRLLDEAGLKDAVILASGDLDENKIHGLKAGGAPIDAWGVGTRLATGHPDGALDGVYKLGAIFDGKWQDKIKWSKSSLTGMLETRRYSDRDEVVDIRTAAEGEFEELLKPIFRGGKLIYEQKTLSESRRRCLEGLSLS